MSNPMIGGKINCSLIDKAKLYDGKKGKMLDFILIPTPNGKYGDDYMICQSVSKEERAKGIKGAILGNAKIIGGAQQPQGSGPYPTRPNQPAPAARPAFNPDSNVDEDVPF